MIVNLQAVPMGPDTYVLECSECGTLDTYSPDDTSDAAFEHLRDIHGVIDIQQGPTP